MSEQQGVKRYDSDAGNGSVVYATESQEPKIAADVRVLIRPEISPHDAVAALRRIIDFIEFEGLASGSELPC